MFLLCPFTVNDSVLFKKCLTSPWLGASVGWSAVQYNIRLKAIDCNLIPGLGMSGRQPIDFSLTWSLYIYILKCVLNRANTQKSTHIMRALIMKKYVDKITFLGSYVCDSFL